MPPLTIDPKTTALILIDLQKGIASMQTVPHPAADVIARGAELAAKCRAHGVLVILVRVDPGPNGELAPSPQADQPRPKMTIPADWCELVPELSQAPGDIVVTKHQPNAFYSTDLEVHLTRRGIRTLILGGISTNVGVEATARAAHERGYEQVFVENAMAARDVELHTVTTSKFLPTIGRVRSATDVLAALG
jgi:nicotinamidase-related amidase